MNWTVKGLTFALVLFGWLHFTWCVESVRAGLKASMNDSPPFCLCDGVGYH